MWSSEADCIRYSGRDATLLHRLARAGMTDQADHPLQSGSPMTLRDRVSFGISAETNLPNSTRLIASTFRTDMRANGNKVLPAIFGSEAAWVSWYQNRFHLVRFIDEGDRRFGARLRSSIALQGLAWLVDDWLRTRSAESIRWEVTGDSMSESRTPM
jgi:hypothetical protein